MRASFILLFALRAAASPFNRLQLRQDVCTGFVFDSGDAAKDTDLWEKTGAGKFLSDFLDKNGAEDWTNKFFQQIVAGGTQMGSTHDCGSFPSDGQCNGPDETPCTTYNPPETFYIHMAIHNLYAAFSTMHEELQDNAIFDLGATSAALTDKYGPKLENPSANYFAIVIGAMVLGTLIPGFGTENLIGLGVFNVIAGGMAAAPAATDPNTFRGDIQEVTSKIFMVAQDQLKSAVQTIFNGKNYNGDVKAHIKDIFNGVEVDSKAMDTMVTNWNTKASGLLKDAALRMAWAKMDHPIKMKLTAPYKKVICGTNGCPTVEMNKEECVKQDGRIWVDEGCLGFGVTKVSGMTTPIVDYMSTEEFFDLMNFCSDPKGAMLNALDCIKSGSVDDKKVTPTTSPQSSFADVDVLNPPAYPKCFWNLDFDWDSEDD